MTVYLSRVVQDKEFLQYEFLPSVTLLLMEGVIQCWSAPSHIGVHWCVIALSGYHLVGIFIHFCKHRHLGASRGPEALQSHLNNFCYRCFILVLKNVYTLRNVSYLSLWVIPWQVYHFGWSPWADRPWIAQFGDILCMSFLRVPLTDGVFHD